MVKPFGKRRDYVTFQYCNHGTNAIFKDRFVKKTSECLLPYKAGVKGEVGMLGLPSSKSSITLSLAANAPSAIRNALYSYSVYSSERRRNLPFKDIIDFGDVTIHPTDNEETINRQYLSVKEILQSEICDTFIFLGGDHGISFPVIKAFAEAKGKIGVIQFDAHHDVRNLEDGGRTNGTPFRSLLDGDIIEGQHLVQIGIRDFANAEEYDHYVREQGVHVYTMGDIDTLGLTSIIRKELVRLSSEVEIIYISLDMDVIDQAFAPACPAPNPYGLTSRELLTSVATFAEYSKVKAIDIVEIDPSKDIRNLTSNLAAYVILTFLNHLK